MQLSTYKGDWALVTGASSGIGREFAVQLAAAGMNLVLVARRKQLLETLSRVLNERHGVEARVISADLAQPGAAVALKSHISSEGCRIRLLCNNAAFGHWGRFENVSVSTYQEMMQLNVGTVVATCREFLGDLRSFPSSVVINVSSAAAFQPVPYMAAYAATKAFVLSFSQALYGEWKEYGILVQTLLPGPTDTEFDTLAGAYPSTLTKRGPVAQVVRESLAHLISEDPVAASARGTFKQRIFAGLFPPRVVIREVAKRFRPPH